MYLISTYGLILELPEEVVSPWKPRLCFTSLESWPGDLVTMGPCAGHMCHGLGVPMSVVTLAVVSAPGGGQEATGAGRGGTTETPATAPLYCDTSVHCTCTFYTALLIHFALRSIYTD